MLVLTRFEQQKICIGERQEVVVTVLDVENGKVRLGFTAPKEIPIDREEIAVKKFFLQNSNKRFYSQNTYQEGKKDV